MPKSEKRKKRNTSRIHAGRPVTAALPTDRGDEIDDDSEIVIRSGDRIVTSLVPGPGNRIGVHDAEAGVLHLPNAALFDIRLGTHASVIYVRLLMAGPEFPGSWDDLVVDILTFPRHPDDSEADQIAALEELRELGYLVPYTDGVGWMLAVPDDAEDHAFDWAQAEATSEAGSTLVGPGPTDGHIDRLHALLTARGWSVEDFGNPEQSPADGPVRPSQNDWTYRLSLDLS